MNFYSQIGQDEWVHSYFGKNYKGFFIDIGANDGISISNTYALELLGWNGICIDANINYKKILSKNRPNSICIISAILNYNGYCHITNNDMLSCIDENNTMKNMTCLTLDTLLKRYKIQNKIDYLSIDVEGSELNVLKGINFENYDIKLITIEHNAYFMGIKSKNEIFNFLNQKGFIRIGEIGENREIDKVLGLEDWYIHKNHIK